MATVVRAVEIAMFIFDRSNLDENVAYDPRTKTHITRREDLANTKTWPRRDIVLENVEIDCTCPDCGTLHKRNRQLWLEVTQDGFTGNLELLERLSPEQRHQVEEIAHRMRVNAIAFPPAAKLIAHILPVRKV